MDIDLYKLDDELERATLDELPGKLEKLLTAYTHEHGEQNSATVYRTFGQIVGTLLHSNYDCDYTLRLRNNRIDSTEY